jgi:hypothetical protein
MFSWYSRSCVRPPANAGTTMAPSTGHRLSHHAVQTIADRRGIVAPIAVGRLDDHVVGVAEGGRIGQDRCTVAAHVTREHDASRAARDGRRLER